MLSKIFMLLVCITCLNWTQTFIGFEKSNIPQRTGTLRWLFLLNNQVFISRRQHLLTTTFTFWTEALIIHGRTFVRRGQWILSYFWKTCPWSLALLCKKKPAKAFSNKHGFWNNCQQDSDESTPAMWGSIQSNTGHMRLTQWDQLYVKAVKSNKEILYFDLVLGIKETPGGLQFHISSDKMIDFFSIEMKAFFNYLKIIQAIITFRLSGKAEQWQEK